MAAALGEITNCGCLLLEYRTSQEPNSVTSLDGPADGLRSHKVGPGGCAGQPTLDGFSLAIGCGLAFTLSRKLVENGLNHSEIAKSLDVLRRTVLWYLGG